MNQHDENIEIMRDLRARLDKVINEEPSKENNHIPNPKMHKYVSFVKSGFRIVAGVCLCVGQLYAAGALLILAEMLGIAEELV